MSKRNKLLDGTINDGWFVIQTDHFDVKIRFKDDCVFEKRNHPHISFDAVILTKTSYFTNYQYKKFLKRFILSALKYKLERKN